MKINGDTDIYGLIGNPVSHTLSPVIHNSLAQEKGHNLVYIPFLVPQGALKEAIKGAYSLQVKGLNVTVPFKEKVMEYLEDIDELAGEIHAVNTLVRGESGFKGYNTDISGLKRAMKKDDIPIKGETVCLLGAGGAAKAAAALCAKEGAAKIYILNRTIEKAQEIEKMVKDTYGFANISSLHMEEHQSIKEEGLLAIQCTSVGLHPKEGKAVIEEEEFYKKIAVGLDLIYKPETTGFMKKITARGNRAYNGLKMLVYQGIIAYELWTETEIHEKTADLIYEKCKAELKDHE